jgi:molybdenum transport protein
MIYITDEEIDKFIKDNITYWYITIELLNIKSSATIVFKILGNVF